MLFENTEVFNFKGAFRGMRNPMASWAKSDSIFIEEKFSKQQYESVRAVAYQWINIKNSDNIDTSSDKRFAEKVNWLTAQSGNYIGPNDFKLMKNLIKGGTEHRKFLRQIMVSVDITAPLYW